MSNDGPSIPQSVRGALLASGFPFQTAVAEVVRGVRNWSLVREEFPWQDDTGAERFLDIVATNGMFVVAIECKKTQKDTFNFLQPRGGEDPITRVRCLHLSQAPDSNQPRELFCSDWYISPSSFQSAFCVISTSDSGKDQRMLERDAQLIVRATDAFAQRERGGKLGHIERIRPYVPLIVTNAPLFITRYDSDAVSLETGQFINPRPDIQPVEWVRFAKAFTSNRGHDLGDRTVFVVNAAAVVRFFEKLDFVELQPSTRGRARLPAQ